LAETPRRVATWLAEFEEWRTQSIDDILRVDFPSDGYKGMIAVRDVSFTSLCAHHLLPYRGVAHVAYIPSSDRVVGISKLARAVHFYTHRITLQERATQQILDGMEECLRPRGAIVVLDAEHQCMTVRGIRDPGARTVTSAVSGFFLDNAAGCKDEFLRLVAR